MLILATPAAPEMEEAARSGIVKCLSNNFKSGRFRSFDRLRTNGNSPLVVSLSNHGGELLAKF